MATRVITLLAFSYAPEAGQNQIAVPNNVIWDMPDGADWLTCDPPKAKLFDPSGASAQNLADEIAARINADEVLASAISSEATLRAEADALKADRSTTISGAGLATGGGSLAANRTINVPIASQAEVVTGTNNTKAVTSLSLPNATYADRGLAKQLVTDDGTTLHPNHADSAVQEAIQVSVTGTNKGNIGLHTAPSVHPTFGTRIATASLLEGASVFASSSDDPAFSPKIAFGLATGFVVASPTQIMQALTSVPYPIISGAWKILVRVSPEAGGSGGYGSIEYNIKFIHYAGVISDMGVSQNGFLTGSIIKPSPNIYIGNVGGYLAILIDSHHTTYANHQVTVLSAEFLPWGTGLPDSSWFSGWSLSAVNSLPETVTSALTIQNTFRNIIANGTISSTGNMSATAFITTSNRDEKENFVPIDFEKIELTGKRLHEIQRDPKQYGYFTYKGSADQREGFYDAQYLYDQIAVIDENLALQIAPITQNFQAEQVIEGKIIAEIPQRRALDYSKIEKCKSAWTSRLAIADYVHTGTSRFITVPQLSRVLSLGRWLPIVAAIMSQAEAVKNQLLGALVALALAGGAELDSGDVQQLLLALVNIGAITNDEFADISNL